MVEILDKMNKLTPKQLKKIITATIISFLMIVFIVLLGIGIYKGFPILIYFFKYGEMP